MTAYDAWLDEPQAAQDDLDAQDDERWQVAHANAAGAMISGLDDDEAAMIAESVDEFISDTMDDEQFKDLNALLIDIAMSGPFDADSGLIRDVRDLIAEKLALRFYKELGE